MKFMMLMIPAIYHGNKQLPSDFAPDPEMMAKMGKYNEELGQHFKLLDLNGLEPLSAGARISFAHGKASVSDGPSIEAGEVLGGYWMLEAPSKEEVVRWAQKCPAAEGDIIEVRQIFDGEARTQT